MVLILGCKLWWRTMHLSLPKREVPGAQVGQGVLPLATDSKSGSLREVESLGRNLGKQAGDRQKPVPAGLSTGTANGFLKAHPEKNESSLFLPCPHVTCCTEAADGSSWGFQANLFPPTLRHWLPGVRQSTGRCPKGLLGLHLGSVTGSSKFKVKRLHYE